MTDIPQWLQSLKNLVMDMRDNNERLPMLGGGEGVSCSSMLWLGMILLVGRLPHGQSDMYSPTKNMIKAIDS
jgi:hypothetical protein